MKINTFLILIILLSTMMAKAQWPVNGGSQGTVTGTIGEVRGTNGGRIHNGTDITGNNNNVYSIVEDMIDMINITNSRGADLGTSRNIEMFSGITYIHVNISNSIAQNQLEIDEINDGFRLVELEQGDLFATMYQGGTWAVHVHVVNDFNENFLLNGFGAEGFSFTDNVFPEFGPAASAVTIYKDMNTQQLWNSATKFNSYVTDEGFAAAERPLIVWGPVDIVANVFQQRINGNGSAGGGHLAPYKLGYNLKYLADNSIPFEDFQRMEFDHGFGTGGVTVESAETFRIIHSKSSTISNPFFIVSNQFVSSTSLEDNLNTEFYKDGDYTLTVKAAGAKGSGAGAPDLVTEKSVKVRLDNYKTYIKKVVVSDENSVVKYFAEWSALTRASDGSILLTRRNSESFKSGTPATILVTTSEKVPSLSLTVPGAAIINMTAVGTNGREWQAQFTMPSAASKKVQLSFKSDDRIFGLVLNQDAADVKRNAAGKFSDLVSIDKNHELKVCPADYPLTLDVTVNNGQDVTLTGANGTPPYEYSIDEMPVQPHHKSVFSTNNTYTIEFDKNYLFKVKDAGGCQSEQYYTLPKVECDALTSAGGQGTDIKQVNLGSIAGTVNVYYEMYGIPDQITITYRGVSKTTGVVSGSGVLSFDHTIVSGQSNLVTITMYAPNSGTAWDYRVQCPGSTGNKQVITSTSKDPRNRFNLKYKETGITITPTEEDTKSLYNIQYRNIGSKEWRSLRNVALPYLLSHGGKEVEVKVIKETIETVSTDLVVTPNPSTGPVTISYSAKSAGSIKLSVFAADGSLLHKEELRAAKGTNTYRWKPGGKISGLLIIQIEQDEIRTAKKVLIQQ